MIKKPLISIGALGGTICMSSNGKQDGVKPTLTAQDLIDAVPYLKEITNIEAQTLQALPSGSIQIEHLVKTLEWAEAQLKKGAKGIVITQGTDTLEESSFLLNLLWNHEEPLVMTGAMRNVDDVSSDGAANILASVLVASDEESKNRGVLVVLNDTIHSAKWVRKSNTFAVNTFISENGGIQGVVAEKEVKYIQSADSRMVFESPNLSKIKVGIVQSYLSDDGSMIEFLSNSGYNGAILNAFGAGHVSYPMMDGISSIKSDMIIIVSSRTCSGVTAYHTYGYKGSEIVLQNSGAIMSGWLNALKSRLLLLVLLGAGKTKDEIKEIFSRY